MSGARPSGLHGGRVPARPGAWASVVGLRAAGVAAVAALLAAGLVGGLLRAGVGVAAGPGAWPGHAVVAHGFMMIGAFMGTVVALERAVALKQRWACAGPAASVLAGLLMLAGHPLAAAVLAAAAAALFVAANVLLVARQRAPHTALLLAGACAWLAAQTLYAVQAPADAVAAWWFTFLVLTIAAERLEMTRLMRRRAGAAPALYGVLAVMLCGAATLSLSPAVGGALFGLALAALALWLALFDIAWRTIAAPGLSRYMALALLLGYGWLAVSGCAWMAAAAGRATRDAALHALALGFVFSMVLAHAPVILPALLRVKLLFGWWFYVPLALLHASLVVRLAFGASDAAWLRIGSAANATAIALFAATVAGSAWGWRRRHPQRPGDHRRSESPPG